MGHHLQGTSWASWHLIKSSWLKVTSSNSSPWTVLIFPLKRQEWKIFQYVKCPMLILKNSLSHEQMLSKEGRILCDVCIDKSFLPNLAFDSSSSSFFLHHLYSRRYLFLDLLHFLFVIDMTLHPLHEDKVFFFSFQFKGIIWYSVTTGFPSSCIFLPSSWFISFIFLCHLLVCSMMHHQHRI